MSIKVGDKAPDFNLPDQDGNNHSLSDLKGKTTLIYFYPKDDTPGCTKQACSLRDNFESLQAKGVDVLGVSKDSQESHIKFIAKYSLPFSMLSDPEAKMISEYGAWAEKSMYGRKFMGIVRSAVLIGPDLIVLAYWPKIQPLKTVEAVEKWIADNK